MKRLITIVSLSFSILAATTTVESYEKVQLESLEHSKISSSKTAWVFRQIENRGKYYGKSKYSSASGGYQMLSNTRKRCIKHIKGVTWSNWSKPSNQDKMFHYENKRNVKFIKSWTSDSIYKEYMTWQMGIGGFKCLYQYANGDRNDLYKVSIKTIYRNIPDNEKHEFQRYMQLKILRLSQMYDVKLTTYRLKQTYANPSTLKHYLKVISKREAGKDWVSYYRTNFKHMYDDGVRHLVVHELNYFKHKVDHYLRKLK